MSFFYVYFLDVATLFQPQDFSAFFTLPIDSAYTSQGCFFSTLQISIMGHLLERHTSFPQSRNSLFNYPIFIFLLAFILLSNLYVNLYVAYPPQKLENECH